MRKELLQKARQDRKEGREDQQRAEFAQSPTRGDWGKLATASLAQLPNEGQRQAGTGLQFLP